MTVIDCTEDKREIGWCVRSNGGSMRCIYTRLQSASLITKKGDVDVTAVGVLT